MPELLKRPHQLLPGLHVREVLTASEHLVEDEAGAPHVAVLGVVAVGVDHHFGGGEEGSAPLEGHVGADVSCQSEVGHLEIAVLIEQYVIGLKIAVDEA